MKRYLAALWENRFTLAVVAAFILASGYVGFSALPRSVFPNVEFPRVSVLVSDGYLPVKVMLVRVTQPLEQAAKGVPDVTLVRSSTSSGLTKIHVYFNTAVRPNLALLMLQARLAQVTLPAGAHVSIRLMMPNIYPFAEYALVSNNVSSDRMMPTYAFTVKPRLLDVQGVYTVDGIGRGWPHINVLLDPRALAERHLHQSAIVQLLKDHQGPYFGGVLNGFHQQFLLTSHGRPETLAGLARLSMPVPGGLVTLGSIAHIIEGSPPRVRGAAVNGWRHALLIDIAAQAGADVEAVAAEVGQQVTQLRKNALPAGVHLIKDYDFSDLIRQSLGDVWAALFLGTVVTWIVLLLFLRRFDTAVATVVIVPLALAATMVVLDVLGLGLNIMTLGGITAAIGVLVDHAIVVIEQASHAATGADPATRRVRALKAAGAVLPMMTLATVTSALVFVPLVFLGGTIGILFQQMAIALVSALVISQIIALTITPVLAAALAGRAVAHGKGWRPARRVRVWYARTLRHGLRRPVLVLPAMLVLALLAAAVFWRLPTAFLPAWDEGVIAVPFRTPIGRSVADTLAVGRGLMRIAKRDRTVRGVSLIVGQSLGNPRAAPNKGDLVIVLHQHRPVSTEHVIAYLSKKFWAAYPGLLMLKMHQILVTQLGNLSGAHSPLDVDLFGHRPGQLSMWATRAVAALKQTHAFSNISYGTSSTGPELKLAVRPRGVRAGLTPDALARQIRQAFWGESAGFMLRGNEILPISVRERPEGPLALAHLLPDLQINTPRPPHWRPLSAVATVRLVPSVPFVMHQNLVPYADIQLHPKSGFGLNQAAARARVALRTLHLPPGITSSIAGYYKEQTKSFAQMEVTLAAALGILLILVGLQLGGQRPALAVLAATGLSAVGTLTALLVTGIPLDSTSFLGLLLVFAIVVNNGILIFSEARLHRSHPGRLEVELAARRRLRPIMMTMLADVLGFLPLAIGIGRGTDLLKPLATAVMGGLSVAILLSLFVAPMFYVWLLPRQGKIP
ncbi:MAG: efflux RND transporter permease subunit [Acidiferrobacteraceae bacterium]